MLITLWFVCQQSSSIAEMNIQSDNVVLTTQPNIQLNQQEIISCQTQDKQTAVYTVTIGSNIFRSSIVIYNAFKDVQIILYPVNGSSVEKSFLFFIASYEISFLESALIQSGVVGQLLSTVYNLNQCLYNYSLYYETSAFIQPIISVNQKCKIIPTDKVQYNYSIQEQLIKTEAIEKKDFNFSVFTLSQLDCTHGTDEEIKNCIQVSKTISKENFISFHVDIKIPKTIISQNIYIDEYGVLVNVSSTQNFELIYNLVISNRLALDSCTKDDSLSFGQDSIRIFQRKNHPCDLSIYHRKTFWVTASELSDNTGKTFELQFYSKQVFDMHSYIDCSTWEISDFESFQSCQQKLNSVQKFASNYTSSIVYKLYDDNLLYQGAYRAECRNLQGGEATIIVNQNSLCVQLFQNYSTSRPFVNINVKISISFNRFQQNIIDFTVNNNVIFPSNDNIYCFVIDDNQQQQLKDVSFQKIYGTVDLLDDVLRIKDIQPLLPYPVFYEAYIFLVGSLIIMIIWVVSKKELGSRKQKAQYNIPNTQ